MLKVFLVEDEYVVREGIKNNVAWKEHGYIFCGEAADGEVAYAQIRLKKPDIIITDIKMPFMNGLELSRLVKKDNPDVKIIILSGYEEFELAKSAIIIGVEEYLLKPINAEELITAVNRVAEKIRLENKEKQNLLKLKKEMEENEVEIKRNFFHELISNTQSLSNKLEKGKQLKLELAASFYSIVLFKVSRVKHGDEEFSNRLVHMYSKLFQYFEQEEIISFDRNLEGIALLLKADTLDEMNEKQKKYITEIEAIIKLYEKVSYFGGVGCSVDRLSELCTSFEDASRAFAYRFIKEKDMFLKADQINNTEDTPWVDMNYTEYLDKEIAYKFLRNGELGEVNFFVEEYFKNFSHACENSIMFRQYIIMDMYFITANFIDQISKKDEGIKSDVSLQNLQNIHTIIKSYKKTIDFIKDLFSQAITFRNEIATRKFSDIIGETKEYIHKNYCEEEISLNSAASYVNISPSYLSSVFSQETGQTFVKYLTDLRMNKAKELLMCTNKRSNEISTEVGYKDPHYFSYLFKKIHGCSPLQYRISKSRKEGYINAQD